MLRKNKMLYLSPCVPEFADGKADIPSMGTSYSQYGNVPFPRWEYLAINSVAAFHNEDLQTTKKTSFIKKVLISPVNHSKVLYIKGFYDFHPSRHLSLITPISLPCSLPSAFKELLRTS